MAETLAKKKLSSGSKRGNLITSLKSRSGSSSSSSSSASLQHQAAIAPPASSSVSTSSQATSNKDDLKATALPTFLGQSLSDGGEVAVGVTQQQQQCGEGSEEATQASKALVLDIDEVNPLPIYNITLLLCMCLFSFLILFHSS